MKAIKKMLSFMLAVVMMMAMTVSVAAAPVAGESKIVINNPEGAYKAYQILTGTVDGEGKLTNLALGGDVENALLDAENVTTADELALKLGDYSDDSAHIKAFAATVKANLVADAGKAGSKVNGKYEITGLATGYYLVENTSNETAANGVASTFTSYLIKVVDGTTEMNPKNTNRPTLHKYIKHNETTEWGKVGDNQIGDAVEFKIESTVASTADYTNYIYQIHDKMDETLTFNANSVVITYDNGTVLDASKYTVVADEDGHGFTIDVKVKEAGLDGKTLVTTFSATLEENAKIHGEKQQNKAWLTYSNNPYDSATGEPETPENPNGDEVANTPEDVVYDWTFEVPVQKYIANSKTPLEGATFTLSKNSNGTNPIAFVKTTAENGDAVYTVAKTGTTGTTTEMVTPASGKIMIKGLDDATTYYLKETEAPAGYNTLVEPVAIKITAAYNEAGNECTSMSISGSTNGTVVVYNNAGATLPSTGGMGTTVFNVVGGMLMVIAAVLLITRKRLSVNR